MIVVPVSRARWSAVAAALAMELLRPSVVGCSSSEPQAALLAEPAPYLGILGGPSGVSLQSAIVYSRGAGVTTYVLDGPPDPMVSILLPASDPVSEPSRQLRVHSALEAGGVGISCLERMPGGAPYACSVYYAESCAGGSELPASLAPLYILAVVEDRSLVMVGCASADPMLDLVALEGLDWEEAGVELVRAGVNVVEWDGVRVVSVGGDPGAWTCAR